MMKDVLEIDANAGIHNIKGWSIHVDDTFDDGDIRKLDWTAVNDETGESRRLDLSPHAKPTSQTFSMMIDMDFPTRHDVGSMGPFHNDDVERMWRERFGNEVEAQENDLEDEHNEPDQDDGMSI